MLYQLSHIRVNRLCGRAIARQSCYQDDRGRYWDRTSDLFRVREARSRCANRPRWVPDSNRCKRLCRPVPSLSANPPGECWGPLGGSRLLGADDGTRTRDPHLGKVMLYQLSHIRVVSRS